MTQPPVIRIFFAIDLPENLKLQLGEFMVSLKKKAKSNAIRWTKAENLHVTLQFLAAVHAEHLTLLVKNVRAEIEGAIDHILLNVGDLNLLPNPYRPRVIVLDITPQTELAMVSQVIGRGIQATQYEIESRLFRAHLTVGRIKHAKGVNLDFLSEMHIPEMSPALIKEVVLFQSEPQPEGSSHYTVLERIPLRAHWTDQV